MPTAPASSAVAGAPGAEVGTGRLALVLQETLTAIVRLRASRQPVTDGAGFRQHVLGLLARADQDARAAGYAQEDARLALFAVTALLDESVLNSAQPALAGWARRPLQDELFGEHLAGERFFQHVEALLARPDSAALADVLEVHLLCLQLGFRGRYGGGDAGTLHGLATRLAERVGRIRGLRGIAPAVSALGDLVPAWRPPEDAVAGRDPWVRRLVVGLVAACALAAIAWGAGALSLRGAIDDLRGLAAPVASR